MDIGRGVRRHRQAIYVIIMGHNRLKFWALFWFETWLPNFFMLQIMESNEMINRSMGERERKFSKSILVDVISHPQLTLI